MKTAVYYGAVVVFVSWFYGYAASGGPVGVGKATARSMMLKMVLIHLCGIVTIGKATARSMMLKMVLIHLCGIVTSQLFWGMAPNAPIAN
jgi:phospholipid/cholesterol/gamma-HCH transport system permease protein